MVATWKVKLSEFVNKKISMASAFFWSFLPFMFSSSDKGWSEYLLSSFLLQICASAVLVPEFTNLHLQDNFERNFFAYSICMSLLPEGCVINGVTFNSC
ncbi:hypothetical protein SLEP1_g47014 [Rubroshorea leprosula]|uniref:Uncharacterized protein n=1 Tax=Rubroshorea leprosula TaxID=152421 RepID=A0AAV5LRT1_9ROSI|nr:hypothetical protein SLEP1_g47014 [Rubroshorea leprosula]